MVENNSKAWQFSWEDFNKFFRNTMVFLAPVTLIYLGALALNVKDNGFQWTDFYVNNFVVGAMFLYLINVGIDFLSKLKKNNAS